MKLRTLVVVAVIVSVTFLKVPTADGGVICNVGESACGNQCYNPFIEICYGRIACKLGQFPCGDRCYTPSKGEVCHKTESGGDYWSGSVGEIKVSRVCEYSREYYIFDKIRTGCWPGVPCVKNTAVFAQEARFHNRPLDPEISTDVEWVWGRLKRSNKECIPKSNLKGEVSYEITWPSGDNYKGQWKDGKYHGVGTYTFKSGSRYLGYFEGDKAHGSGIYVAADGKKYSVRAVNGCIGLAEWWPTGEGAESEREFMARIGASSRECPVR